MSARTDVLLWAQRVLARKTATAYQILEVAAGSTMEAAQEAFHKIARLAHPDLHRTTLSPDELELVTQAYSRAAAAYQEIRVQKRTTTKMIPLQRPADPTKVQQTTVIPTSPSPNKAVPMPDAQPINPVQAMTSKALIYYRKAELCLRRGELTGAVLQLKMAIASDPQSPFLRSALAEVQAEVTKKP
jgi:hypothetical protein